MYTIIRTASEIAPCGLQIPVYIFFVIVFIAIRSQDIAVNVEIEPAVASASP